MGETLDDTLGETLGGPLGGRQLGPYLLVERLGGGAMATVYRATDQRNGRAVAVKVLRPDADTVMRERFRREAETHTNLNHPNIVQILDVGQAPGSGLTYIAMELVDGPNLSEVMEETGRLTPGDAACVLEPIAAALDYAARQGVIHRDVKPSNVLLRRVHEDTPNAVRIAALDVPVLPLLSDFGIARALDAPELTSAGRTIGTPTYMSPEQCADSHEIDGRSDLYSLGAVFYRCVVGRPPYSGTTTQILHAHVYDPLTIPDDVLAGLPPLAVTVLRRTLAKDPNQRYRNGSELAADLHTLLQLAPPAAPNGAGDLNSGEATATMPVLPVLSAVPPVQWADSPCAWARAPYHADCHRGRCSAVCARRSLGADHNAAHRDYDVVCAGAPTAPLDRRRAGGRSGGIGVDLWRRAGVEPAAK